MKHIGWLRAFGFAAITLIFTLVLSAQESAQSGLPGNYRKDAQSGTYLVLTPSFGFILHTQGERRPSTGNYTIEGNVLTLIGGVDHQSTVYTVQGETLYAPDGAAWVKQGTAVPQQAAQAAPVGPYAAIAGEYVLEATGMRLLFLPDGSCSVRSPGVQQVPCNLTADGDWLVVTMRVRKTDITLMKLRIQGGKLYFTGTIDPAYELVRQGGPPAPAHESEAQAAPVGPYAAVAGEYFWETTGNRYVLLPDGSCTVRAPGGTQNPCQFIVDGDWIRLTMKIGGANFPMGSFKMQGDKLYLNGMITENAELIRQGVPPAPPPAQHKYEDLAAPQPPPAPAPTISMGQSKDQVIAAFGEPQRKAAAGPKEIFFYTDLKMKLTFTNGRVSGIE